ncbi:hypothetical protein AAC387_Pa03g4477 [Persea americana]
MLSLPAEIGSRKLHLIPWKPDMEDFEWPNVAPVWIRIRNLPHHCWSGHILFSLARAIGKPFSLAPAIGKPLKLDEYTAFQKLLSFARVCVELDFSKDKPHQIWLQFDDGSSIALDVSYESIPCKLSLKPGHIPAHCSSSGSSKDKMKQPIPNTPHPQTLAFLVNLLRKKLLPLDPTKLLRTQPPLLSW